MQYLIGYDISDSKRLQRFHRKLSRYALPLQYSIFLFEGTEQELMACLNKLLNILNKKEDDLRVYPLPSNGKIWQIGKPLFPDGIVYQYHQ